MLFPIPSLSQPPTPKLTFPSVQKPRNGGKTEIIALSVLIPPLKSRLKHPQGMHLVIIPRLMTGKWRRHLTRGTDVYFKVDWEDVWNLDSQFEPVLCFIALTKEQNLWNNFRGVCRKLGCGTYLQFDAGIFCGNFLLVP